MEVRGRGRFDPFDKLRACGRLMVGSRECGMEGW
jgi:hypothetical protein